MKRSKREVSAPQECSFAESTVQFRVRLHRNDVPATFPFRPIRYRGKRVGTPEITEMEFNVSTSLAHRPVRPAMLRGWRRLCPNCGEGPLLKGFLKVRDACSSCGEELHHHRADDGPAYLTILLVGHLMAPLILWFFETFRPAPLVTATVFTTGCVALSLCLLPRFKGAIVGIQWAKRMHGFGSCSRAASGPEGDA